jgi:hypothetical protein
LAGGPVTTLGTAAATTLTNTILDFTDPAVSNA